MPTVSLYMYVSHIATTFLDELALATLCSRPNCVAPLGRQEVGKVNTAAFGEINCLKPCIFQRGKRRIGLSVSKPSRIDRIDTVFNKRMVIQAISTLGYHRPKREVKSHRIESNDSFKDSNPDRWKESSAILRVNRFDFM